MEDYDVRSAASILASVKEQEARFEQLTRALEEERRNVTLQLDRANMPPNPTASQPLAWQQVVMQVNDASMLANHPLSFSTTNMVGQLPCVCLRAYLSEVKLASPAPSFHLSKFIPSSRLLTVIAFHHLWNLSVHIPCDLGHTCSRCLDPTVLDAVQ